MDISLKDCIAPSFYKLHNLLDTASYSDFWLSGGRGSTKSSWIAIEIILGIMDDPESHGIAFRKYTNTIRRSIHATFEWAIELLGVSHKWKSTVAPFEFTYLPTGQKIFESGLDDPKKMKSLKIKDGYFKFVWFEELEEYNGMAEVRSVIQSVVRGSGKNKVFRFFSYNPPRDPQAWVNKEKEKANKRRICHHSTYLDVNPAWLGEEFIEDANQLKEDDDDLYRCEYLGLSIGLSESVIMNGKYVIRPFEVESWWSRLRGVDWGFSQDPMVIVDIYIAPHEEYGDNCLYIRQAEFEKGVDNNDIHEVWDRIPDSKKYVIRADNSRPETISHMNREGYNVAAADKWTGCVEDGIAFIRSFDKIIIHSDCEEMAEEARLYSFKIDKITKDILTDIVDKFNHGWDAIRYALDKLIKERLAGFTKQQQRDNNRRVKTTLAPSMNEKSW